MIPVTEIKMPELAAFLPPKLVEIAEAIESIDAALKLSAAWPGIRVFVPKTMTADHPIAIHMGMPAATKLASIYGGESLVVPMATRYHKQRLRAQILAELGKASAAELARKYGVHQFTIYNWQAASEAEKQGSLL